VLHAALDEGVWRLHSLPADQQTPQLARFRSKRSVGLGARRPKNQARIDGLLVTIAALAAELRI
jgi:hypothetical protein